MKTAIILTAALLLIAGCVQQTPNDSVTPTAPTPQPPSGGEGRYAAVDCPDGSFGAEICTLEYNPVCANGKTYGNPCQACSENYQYFPVACEDLGNDAGPIVTRPADEGYIGCTEEQRNIPCTKEYRPVCANKDTGIRCITEPCDSSEYVEYGNACSACADPAVYGYYEGTCEEAGPGQNPPAGKCPADNIRYAAQIGFGCVMDYGPEDITSWPTCKRPSDCGELPTGENACVLADRLPSGREIGWEGMDEYRCVPQDYYNWLLHTSGVTGVDENGERYGVIA